MSYPIQPYNRNQNQNRIANIERALARPSIPNNSIETGAGELIGSLFGLATQLMSEIMRHGLPDMTAMMIAGADGINPNNQMFGVSSMNITQIAQGPDGRPHIVQAHDERRFGPGGIVQTKRALKDPERGINKMEIGYFAGDQSEVIEHDFSNGQNQPIQRPALMHNNNGNYSQKQQQPQQQHPQQQHPQQQHPQQQHPQQQQWSRPQVVPHTWQPSYYPPNNFSPYGQMQRSTVLPPSFPPRYF